MAFLEFSEETFLNDIKQWIESGGSPKIAHPKSGWTLLHFAAEFQNITSIEYLINSGCELNMSDKNGQTPLHIAVDSEIDGAIQNNKPLEYKATIKLIEFGANMTLQDIQGQTPIDWIDHYGEKARQIFQEVINR